MKTTAIIGRESEAAAEAYYAKMGFITLDRNFRVREGEIDLVLQRAQLLLFVEVKGRTRDWERHAWLPDWRHKLKRLNRAIRRYLQEHRDLDFAELRLEVVFVTQGRVAARFERI